LILLHHLSNFFAARLIASPLTLPIGTPFAPSLSRRRHDRAMTIGDRFSTIFVFLQFRHDLVIFFVAQYRVCSFWKLLAKKLLTERIFAEIERWPISC